MLTALILALCFVVVYVYALYPLAAILLVKILPPRGRPPAQDPFPSLSLVVPAYNEAAVIESKVRNCLELQYPRERLEVVIVSDGSTDATAEIATGAAAAPVRIVAFPSRRGKTLVLNEIIPALTGQIVVQSDANSRLSRDALMAIASPFADAATGCVVGQLVFSNREDPRVASGEGLYWSYENRLKAAESRLGWLVTANGGIYAFRRILFEPLPSHIAGDAADPLLIARKGFRVVFEPSAVAVEKAAESLREEFARKVRIMTQGLAAYFHVKGMLVPLRPRLAFALLSHKLLRWALPWCLLLLLALTMLPEAPLWARAFGVLQILFYALGVFGLLAGPRARRPRAIGLAAYFCMANAAAAAAWLSLLGGRRFATWEKGPTSR